MTRRIADSAGMTTLGRRMRTSKEMRGLLQRLVRSAWLASFEGVTMMTDILDEHIELNICNYDHEDVAALNSWAIQACDEIERLRASLPRWIPVGEKMPGEGEFFVLRYESWDRGNGIAIGWMSNEKLMAHGVRTEYMTHWMPLPNVPS